MKKLFLLVSLLVCFTGFSQTKIVTIVPEPVQLTMNTGSFSFDKSTIILAGKSAKHEADMLNVYLNKLYGFTLPVKEAKPTNSANTIVLQ